MTVSLDGHPWPSSGSRRTSRQSDLFDRLVEIFLREGFAHFTLADLAARLRCSKSSLYALAHSKEQLAVAVVVHFFRTAAAEVERRVAGVTDPGARVGTYLAAVAEELKPASEAFRRDLAAFPPARDVYELNTRIAAARIRTLVAEGVADGAFRDVHASFVGHVATLAMVAIQQGEVAGVTGLSDADAYAELAKLLLHGIVRDTGTGTDAAGRPGQTANGLSG
ncbi:MULTISPECIES: TetR/AcrR family transcriptional regulator [Protofrankia]|uniref:Regulatory protein TetR n=1 Tax=Candidatus Protofrankia datiscae TaxID=2716812 RepID=F8AXR9_9ACTN|nr:MULTISPECIES: TetR/AcrR family transcriptional regulator [Protofrankia]AEH11487.1 regulatory protein TetR [Candidatus Protofrankia datiscae]